MNDWNAMFDFVLPTKIIFGAGCVTRVGEEMAKLGGRKPLLITDAGIEKAGIVQRVLDAFGADCVVFNGVEQNPKDANVVAGAKKYREAGADCMIAVGGGSPIDCAKAIGVLVAGESDDVKQFEGKTATAKPIPPLITVPTTSGTGSELTFSAVITDSANKYKMTIKNAYTAAKVAVCDPCLTLSVPPSVTAATGIDALTHAIEAYTATCAEPISDAVALYAVELIYGSLVEAYKNGDNLEARSKMLMGSMLAGIAFSHSDVASVHCIAESLGGMFDLPHGMCNAIILPYMMEYNIDYCMDRYARLARAMGLTPDKGREGAMRAVQAVQQLAADVGLPPFESLRITEDQFPVIAKASAKNISTMSNLRPMTEEDYLNVLHMASRKAQFNETAGN